MAEEGKAAKGPPKGKGKGPSGPSKGKAKGAAKGKEAPAVPAWQKPDISPEWQVERMVNWQPIRQTSRLEGSVWQQVHDSLDGGAAQLPEDLLGRFMRKVSEVPQKRPSDVQKKTAAKRLLSAKQGLVADIHHALLSRKGIRSVNDLGWILGTKEDSPAAMEEELLEALQGLLAAAVGEERGLTAAAMKDGVASELFLRQILEKEALQELQTRVQLNLDMARFKAKAKDLETGLDLALTAAWTIIDSKALPILLEGILLLGNSVNASSKNLGGAVGVTLESLTKLAHTRCLPAKASAKRKSTRVESALEVLALHLDKANDCFICNLISDLDACQSAKDFDHKMMDGFVKELAIQVGQVHKYVATHPDAETPCVRPARLQEFSDDADLKVKHLQDCLEELDEATVSLRQWFAEPPSSSLHDMLKALAALRQLLPAPKQGDTPGRAPDYRQSATRKRRLEEKRTRKEEKRDEDVAVTVPIPAEMPEPAVPVVEAEAEAENQQEFPQTEVVEEPLATLEGCEAPGGVLAQILSFSKGTVWISWIFDWSKVRGLADQLCAFEVLQLGPSNSVSARWRCPSAPWKTEVPLGCHYAFSVRAILVKGGLESDVLATSPMSPAVMLDLRYSTSSTNVSPSPTAVLPRAEEKSPASSHGTPRRGRVASSMGDFISSLQSGGSPATRRLSLRPPRLSEDEGQAKSPTTEPRHSEPETGDQMAKPVATQDLQVQKAEVDAVQEPMEPEAACLETELEASPLSVDETWSAKSPSEMSSLSLPRSTAQDFSELDDFDDESLLRLAQAFGCLEQTRAAPEAPKQVLQVPRATSIFDDLGTLESMADVLSNVEAVNLETNAESPAGCAGEILDGAEVLAEIERKYRAKKCEVCNGTGHVGLFGATGFGFFQTKCSSCKS